jgi:hypothetical protein
MNPTTVAISVLLALVIFLVPRKYLLVPFVVTACFIPVDQRIIIAGLDFTVLRILILVGVTRLFLRSEVIAVRWNRFDYLYCAWALVGSFVYTIQHETFSAAINRCGVLFDMLGLYWLFRQKVNSLADVNRVIWLLAWCAIGLVPLVMLEWVTGRNPFEILGRVVTLVREGRYRCQASFPHAIMLGIFWASLVPVFIGMALAERKTKLYWSALAASVIIIVLTASSTPLATLMQVLLLMCIFRYRRHGKAILWGFVGLLCCLHMVMEAPVWHLIARANLTAGSTGWHRFFLMDQAINRFGEWAFLGVTSTGHWGRGLQDVTNQYVLEGVRGGMITLIIFVCLLYITIRTFGRFSLSPMAKGKQWLYWTLAVAMLGHCLAFIAVSYFGQILLLFYLFLAMAGAIYGVLERSSPRRVAR